jgi:predicted Rossmann fold flavoprotein
VVLDMSRHWHAAQADGKPASLRVNFLPGSDFQAIEEELLSQGQQQPRATIHRLLARRLPSRVAEALLADTHVPGETPLAQLPRTARRELVRTLAERELPVTGSRGFGFAEVTAGGVPLTEVDPSTLESRCCERLFLVGEILDVDGRIGGFNFQWAWASGRVVAAGIAQCLPG